MKHYCTAENCHPMTKGKLCEAHAKLAAVARILDVVDCEVRVGKDRFSMEWDAHAVGFTEGKQSLMEAIREVLS